jgi:hypothetical protein
MRTHFRLFVALLRGASWCGAALVTPALFAAASAATPGVTTINNPGGGTIAYAQLPQQHTTQGAMGKVLQYATTALGGRPTIDKVMQSPDGHSLALTFSIKPSKGGSVSGLALVAVSDTGPGAGAILSDTDDHFRTSLKPMLARLQQEAVAKGGSAGAKAAIANAGGGGESSSSSSSGASSSKTATTTSATLAPPKPSAPPQKLTQAQFPDGSGSVGLPAGWTITNAREGDVLAQGPHGEKMRFGMAQSAIDFGNPQSRALGRGPGGTAPGNYVAIPAGTPGDVAFKMMVAQLAQKQRRPAPVVNYAVVQALPVQGSSRNYFMVGTTTMPDGSTDETWIEVMESTTLMMGTWQMNVYQITVPTDLSDQEANTVASMFSTYKTNNAVMMNEITADNRQIQQVTKNFMDWSKKTMDASDRSTTATTNYLLGQTVVSDSALNAHGTVSDDVANALIAANPNRFQAVSSGGFVKGIDY